MKTNYLRGSALLIATLALAMTANAQKTDTVKHKRHFDRYNNDHVVNYTSNGIRHEHISTNWKGTYYEATLVNNKMTELYVEGEKIPQADWGKYATAIAQIREQIRKDEIQARKDQAQARIDQEQAKKDQEEAARDQEEAKKDQEEAKRDQEEAARDQEQAKKDQAQAKLDQEQAVRDQIQAKHDQEEAAEDQRQMKLMIKDLIADKIISNEDDLHDLTLNPDEMTVNGVKQPDEVFKKYRDKYPRFSKSRFSFGENSGNGDMHMSRQSIGE